MNCLFGPLRFLLGLLVPFLESLGASSPWSAKVTPPVAGGALSKNSCFESLAPAEDLKALTCSTCSLDLRANSSPNKEGATSSKLKSSLMRGMRDLFSWEMTLDCGGGG